MKLSLKFILVFILGCIVASTITAFWLYNIHNNEKILLEKKARDHIELVLDWVLQNKPRYRDAVTELSRYLNAKKLKNRYRITYSPENHFFILSRLSNLRWSSKPILTILVAGKTKMWLPSDINGSSPFEEIISKLESKHKSYNTSIERNSFIVCDQSIPYLYSPDGEGGAVLSAVIPIKKFKLIAWFLSPTYEENPELRVEIQTIKDILLIGTSNNLMDTDEKKPTAYPRRS
jgi:hypothetical protein